MSKIIKYGSVCSGIEAASVAWHSMGWEPQWFSEIEPFPCKVLQHHYPEVPNLGDMTKLKDNETFQRSTVDLIVGGTPCQSFSLAGLRNGLDSANGNLALEFCRILIAKRPRWFLWENVPGALSSFSDETKGIEGDEEREVWETSDFATLLTAFRECGYSCSWRVLDAQYFGVPQRRRRVFVVGYIGDDWRPSAAVLFERESLRRDFAKMYEQRKETAIAVRGNAESTNSFCQKNDGGIAYGIETMHSLLTNPSATSHNAPNVITPCFWDGKGDWPKQVTQTLDRSFGQKWGLDNQHVFGGCSLFVPVRVVSKGQMMPEKGRFPAVIQTYGIPGNWIGRKPENGGNATTPMFHVAPCLTKADMHGVMAPFAIDCRNHVANENISGTLQSKPNGGYSLNFINTIMQYLYWQYIVRRLTPLECERLQGFPDNWTNIPGAKDTPRYQAIGNSMAVPVMRWIGERIQKVEEVINSLNKK